MLTVRQESLDERGGTLYLVVAVIPRDCLQSLDESLRSLAQLKCVIADSVTEG